MNWLGLDIGGANLKAADGNGYAHSMSFPLWKQPGELAEALGCLIRHAPPFDLLAITMTGELADCFETKVEGVTHILRAAESAAVERNVHCYLTSGKLVTSETALESPLQAAASNWHVLSTFASRYLEDEAGLLIDIGSTTCDIVPLDPSGPTAMGTTDPERLQLGELVYTGVERSPSAP